MVKKNPCKYTALFSSLLLFWENGIQVKSLMLRQILCFSLHADSLLFLPQGTRHCSLVKNDSAEFHNDSNLFYYSFQCSSHTFSKLLFCTANHFFCTLRQKVIQMDNIEVSTKYYVFFILFLMIFTNEEKSPANKRQSYTRFHRLSFMWLEIFLLTLSIYIYFSS